MNTTATQTAATKIYLSCADTAKLIRSALKEAFPGIKFSVRSHTYSGGSSINVSWTDGPNNAQVEYIADSFSGSYFDGSIDYKGSVYHLTADGKQVSMGTDFVFCNRNYTDATTQRAIDSIKRHYAGNLKDYAGPAVTIEEFNKGGLRSAYIDSHHYNYSISDLINQTRAKASDRLKICKSKTANYYFVSHDDGYSQSCRTHHESENT